MATVVLRDYIERVETMLTQGQYDRVIRYCQHALRTSPRCVDLYRLLGQACMESGRPDDAADMFRRVLGVDPQNFVARVGLGVVAEGAGALDEADWQWNRALELEPNNVPVREELQSLRARMGLAEPGARLHLSRTALGYIYMRGEQYDRASDEFRAVLRAVTQNGAAEHDRFDVQIALSEALFRAGRRREAADVCRAVLKILPNALKANLILAGIYQDTERADEAAPLFERAAALDPSNRLARNLLDGSAPVQAVEITLDEPASGPLIAPLPAARPKPAAEPAPAPAAETAPPADTAAELPDWLVALRGDTSAAPPAPPPLAESAEPDWLRALHPVAPDDVSPVTEVAPETLAPEQELPDWLKQLRTPAAAEPTEAVAPAESAPIGLQPDVIAPAVPVHAEPPAAIEQPAPVHVESGPAAAGVAPTAPPDETAGEPPAASETQAPAAGVAPTAPPDEIVGEPPAAPETPAPAALQPPEAEPAAETAQAAGTAELPPLSEPPVESLAQTAELAAPSATDDGMPEMPEWLKALQARAAESAPPASVEPPPEPPPPPAPPPPAEPIPDVPDWLKALRAETPPAPASAPREASAYLDDAAAPPSVEAQVAPTGEAEHQARLELARMLVDLDVDEALDQYAQLGAASPAIRQLALDDVTALARRMGAHPHVQSVLAQLGGEAAGPPAEPALAVSRDETTPVAEPAAEPAELSQMVAAEVTAHEPAEPIVSEEAVETAAAESGAIEPEAPAMPIVDEAITPPAPVATPSPREASVYLDDASAPPSVERQELPKGAAEYRAWLDLARALKFIDVGAALDQYARLGGAPADVHAEAIKDLRALARASPRAAQLLAQLSGDVRTETPEWIGEAQANLPAAAPERAAGPIVEEDALLAGTQSQAQAAPLLPVVDEEIMDEPVEPAPAVSPAVAAPAQAASTAVAVTADVVSATPAVGEATVPPAASETSAGAVPAAPASAAHEATAYLEDASAPPSIEAQAAPTGEAEHQARLDLARTLDSVDLSESLAQYRFLIDAQSALLPQVIDDLQAIVARDPQARAARVCLADALTNAGRLAEAIGQYRLIV